MTANTALPCCLLLALAGFSCLAFAMDRHRTQPEVASASIVWLRVTGAFSLLLSAFPACSVWGIGIGLVGWIGMLTPSAAATALLLQYLPRFVRYLAGFALLTGLAVMGIGLLA